MNMLVLTKLFSKIKSKSDFLLIITFIIFVSDDIELIKFWHMLSVCHQLNVL